MTPLRLSLVVAFLAVNSQGYTVPARASTHSKVNKAVSVVSAKEPVSAQAADASQDGHFSNAVMMAAAGFSLGAALSWLNRRREQVASATAAAVVALSPIAATAMVDYDGVQYLGGSDKVDINNANVQAYRQFPGMYPSAAGQICSHGPYKSVADIYNIPGLKEELKNIIKKYEGNLVVLPANPAYFIDRINNGLYR